jgi:hypothetical protein
MPASQDDSQRNRRTAKRILAIGLPLVVIAGTGIGYAYWTTNGSGTGTADVAPTNAASAIQLNQVSAPTGIVLGQTVNVVAKAHNPASYSQAAGAVTATPTYPGACGSANWTFTPAATAPVVGSLAGGADSANLTVGTLKLEDLSTNQDTCKATQVTFVFSAATGS